LASATEDRIGSFLTDAEGRGADPASARRPARQWHWDAVGPHRFSDMAEVAAGQRRIPAGRWMASRPVAAILGVVTPLQLLTERLARPWTNPDTIGREDPRQAAAASA
jgi:hypothetical protein